MVWGVYSAQGGQDPCHRLAAPFRTRVLGDGNPSFLFPCDFQYICHSFTGEAPQSIPARLESVKPRVPQLSEQVLGVPEMASSSNPYEHYDSSTIEQDLIDPDEGTSRIVHPS